MIENSKYVCPQCGPDPRGGEIHAEDKHTFSNPAQGRLELLEDILGSVWLHGDWRWLTKKMTTEEREAFADMVDAWSQRLNDGETDPVAPRWWRDDYITDCICRRTRDTGGYTIADLTCPVHGSEGTQPASVFRDDEE